RNVPCLPTTKERSATTPPESKSDKRIPSSLPCSMSPPVRLVRFIGARFCFALSRLKFRPQNFRQSRQQSRCLQNRFQQQQAIARVLVLRHGQQRVLQFGITPKPFRTR